MAELPGHHRVDFQLFDILNLNAFNFSLIFEIVAAALLLLVYFLN